MPIPNEFDLYSANEITCWQVGRRSSKLPLAASKKLSFRPLLKLTIPPKKEFTLYDVPVNKKDFSKTNSFIHF